MAHPVNVGINGNTLVYDRSSGAFNACKPSDFSFEIQTTASGRQQAVFRITHNGQLLRENISKEFPHGAVVKKSLKVNRDACLVEVKNAGNVDLGEVFK